MSHATDFFIEQLSRLSSIYHQDFLLDFMDAFQLCNLSMATEEQLICYVAIAYKNKVIAHADAKFIFLSACIDERINLDSFKKLWEALEIGGFPG